MLARAIGVLAALGFGGASPADGGSYYGGAQAARGEVLYGTYCSQCHGAKLEGATSVALSGAHFEARWGHADLSIDDLLYIVSTQMPYGAPGSLTQSQYLDIVCHILEANRYPGGGADLALDRTVLNARKLGRQTAPADDTR